MLRFRIVRKAPRSGGLPCFTLVRNESYFLPHFLRHYRALGVGHFIFYDDHSTDATRAMLLAEEDCTVIESDHGYGAPMEDGRPFDYHARRVFPEYFARGGWCVVVDADEFLLLPSRFPSLHELVAHLDRSGELCAIAPMVDLYPPTLAGRHYPRALAPFDGAQWWFDSDPLFERTPGSPRIKALKHGIRVRLAALLYTKFRDIYDQVYAMSRGKFYYAKLWKVPVIRTGRGITRLNAHSVSVETAHDLQLGIAHFRFHPDVDAKISEGIITGNFRGYTQELVFLQAAFDHLANEPLIFERSVRFEGAGSLEAAGLMF